MECWSIGIGLGVSTRLYLRDWGLQRFEQFERLELLERFERRQRLLPHHRDRDRSRNYTRRAKHGTQVDLLNPAQEQPRAKQHPHRSGGNDGGHYNHLPHA